MKKAVFRFVSIALTIVLLIMSLSVMVDGYDIYTYNSYNSLNNVRMVQNEHCVFLVGTNGNIVQLDAVYPDSYSINLTLENQVYSYNLYDNILLACCPVEGIDQTQIVIYNIDTDVITTFNIADPTYYESTQLAYADGYVYLSDDHGAVKQYASNGRHIKTYNIHHDRCYLMCDYSGGVYAVSNSGSIYEIYNKTATLICNTAISAPATFISDSIFVDYQGYFYSLNPNGISRMINTYSTVYYPSGGIYSNHAIISDNNTLYAVNLSNSRTNRYINLQGHIESICVINDNIFAFGYHNNSPTISRIVYSDMKTIPLETTAPTHKPASTQKDEDNQNTDSTKPATDNSTKPGGTTNPGNNNAVEVPEDVVESISSNVYTVDHQRLKIINIPPKTTAAEFKRNMNYNGYNVKFVKYNGKEFKTGQVGTATVVTFYNDNIAIEYELSVNGDLTGEGNMNSRDKQMMFDYLLESVTFTGVYVDAADLYESNTLDIRDLILLARAIDGTN